MKKVLAFGLAVTMAASMTACGGGTNSSVNSNAVSQTGAQGDKSIYYLNFKPEVAPIYEEIAKAYQAETGVTLNVVTAAANTYEQTLKSEIAKADAPTIFQVNGPRGYASWKDYCANLKDTQLYQHLSDKSLAITDGDGVYGIPYVVEGYGIIYNQAIMNQYFKTAGAKAASTDEINSFEKLKAVAEDMTAKKDQLGIKGVFSSTSLKPGDDWRWQTHLANLPVYYEFKENKVDLTSDATREIKFQYADNFKNIFDLYLNNSVTPKNLLGTKQVTDSMAEFALGQTAMVQNGNWAWDQISKVQGNTVKAEDIKFMPIYTGVKGEEKQGLCIGTENFFAVNSQVSEEKQKLAEEFLYWLYSSKTGKNFVTNELKFIAPFDTFGEDEKPTDPLAKEVLNWMSKDGVETVPWNFTVFPSQTFKNDFGAVLLQYAQGTKSWDDVNKLVVSEWKTESTQ